MLRSHRISDGLELARSTRRHEREPKSIVARRVPQREGERDVGTSAGLGRARDAGRVPGPRDSLRPDRVSSRCARPGAAAMPRGRPAGTRQADRMTVSAKSCSGSLRLVSSVSRCGGCLRPGWTWTAGTETLRGIFARLDLAGTGLLYGVVGIYVEHLAMQGGGSGDGNSRERWTAWVLSKPFGPGSSSASA